MCLQWKLLSINSRVYTDAVLMSPHCHPDLFPLFVQPIIVIRIKNARVLYSVFCGNEDVSLSGADVNRYVVIRQSIQFSTHF